MNRELAESYVQYGINSTIFTKKNCTAFLPFNILFLVIAVALFQQLYFIIIVVLIIIQENEDKFLEWESTDILMKKCNKK